MGLLHGSNCPNRRASVSFVTTAAVAWQSADFVITVAVAWQRLAFA